MAPKDVYQDDSALTSFLDGLIDSGQEETRASQKQQRDLSYSSGDISFSATNLGDGIAAANELLREGGLCAPLPTLSDDGENIPDVLAAAVSAIVRLSRCCKANVNLRTEAERNTQAAQTHVEDLSRLLKNTKEKADKKSSALAAVRNTMAEAEEKHRNRVRRLNSECSSLKARLVNAARREDHLNLEAVKRERQFSMLQKRVHTLMASSKKLSIEPVVTSSAATLRLPKAKYAAFGGNCNDALDSDCTGIEDDVENGPLAAVLEENYLMRGTVRAVHLELDDFFERYPKAFASLFPLEKSNSGERELDTQVSKDICKADHQSEDAVKSFSGETKPLEDCDAENSAEENFYENIDSEQTAADGDNANESGPSERNADDSDENGVDGHAAEELAEQLETETDDAEMKQEGLDVADDVSVSPDLPPSAPSEHRMLLPYDMIRDEFEANLERKLSVVRAALANIQ